MAARSGHGRITGMPGTSGPWWPGSRRAQLEVVMAPAVSPPEPLIDDCQPLLPEPAHRLVTTREIVVTGRVFLGKLAPHPR